MKNWLKLNAEQMNNMTHMAEIQFKMNTKISTLKNIVEEDLRYFDVILIKNPLFNSYLPQIFSKLDFDNSIIKQILDLVWFLSKIINDNCKLCILTEPYIIPYIQGILSKNFKYQQWLVIRTVENDVVRKNGLDSRHVGILILTRGIFSRSLQHSKVHVKYTYCPTCQKTTKDYGGRKHLYHEFGTLMSDIWQDMKFSRNEKFNENHEICIRIRDMFSIDEIRGKDGKKKEKNNGMLIIPIENIDEIRNFNKDHEISSYSIETLFPKIQPLSISSENLDLKTSKIIKGDCLEELKKIPDNSIDLIFVDPPYNVDKKYDSYNDSIEMHHYFEWCDKWIEQLVRILKNGGNFFLLNIPLYTIRHFFYLQQKLTFQNWIVWDSLSLPVRNIMPAHYSILYYTKGDKPNTLIIPDPKDLNNQNGSELNYLLSLKDGFCIRQTCINKRMKMHLEQYEPLYDIWTGIHRLKHNVRRFDHPTQLPPMLLKKIISIFSNKNDIVLDCFNGIGTTTLCANLLKRRYIGIEKSEKYFEISLLNHKDVANGLDPFRKKEKTPQAKNSRVKRQGLVEYEVSKKELQLYVKKLAQKIGRRPSREDVIKDNKYPIKYFDAYFVSWGEVVAAARTTGMSEYKVKPADLISYFRDLYTKIGHIPLREDIIHDGLYQIELFDNYFSSWDDLVEKSGLKNNFNNKEESKKNILTLDKWITKTEKK